MKISIHFLLEEFPDSALKTKIKKHQDAARELMDTTSAKTNEAYLKKLEPSDISGLQISNEESLTSATIRVTTSEIKICLDISNIEYQEKFLNSIEKSMDLNEFLGLCNPPE